ncbi:MAG: hypothetical protein ABJD68_16350, partial [Nakamurella sp.]
IRPVALTPTPVATAVATLFDGEEPRRILVIGTRWDGELDAAAAAGCVTALVDRYRRGLGSPDWRATGLADLADRIRSWAAAGTGAGTGAGPAGASR